MGKFYATYLIQDYFRKFRDRKVAQREAEEKAKAGSPPTTGANHNNSKDIVRLQAGLRALQDTGPELKRALSGNVKDDLKVWEDDEDETEPEHRVSIQHLRRGYQADLDFSNFCTVLNTAQPFLDGYE